MATKVSDHSANEKWARVDCNVIPSAKWKENAHGLSCFASVALDHNFSQFLNWSWVGQLIAKT